MSEPLLQRKLFIVLKNHSLFNKNIAYLKILSVNTNSYFQVTSRYVSDLTVSIEQCLKTKDKESNSRGTVFPA